MINTAHVSKEWNRENNHLSKHINGWEITQWSSYFREELIDHDFFFNLTNLSYLRESMNGIEAEGKRQKKKKSQCWKLKECNSSYLVKDVFDDTFLFKGTDQIYHTLINVYFLFFLWMYVRNKIMKRGMLIKSISSPFPGEKSGIK